MTDKKRNQHPELVFWFDFPPHVSAGTFSYLTRKWGNRVYYLCVNPMKKERRAIGWNDCDHGDAIITILMEQPSPYDFIKDFVHDHPEAIHVCNGFRSSAAPFFKKWVFCNPDAKAVLWSESPGVYGSPLKRFLKAWGLPSLHRYFFFRYGRMVKAFLPLGTMAVEYFAKCGWSRDILFPFLYAGHSATVSPEVPQRVKGMPLRLLYLGQFLKRKGIAVLIEAIEKQLSGGWRLDLVGRNGDCEQMVLEWAEKHPNVSYLGVWPYTEVGQRIREYDVCIVPSEFDGWAYFTNEALHAGIGVIVADGAASFDLVKASNAGIVVPAGNPEALRKAIQTAIDNPQLVEVWKEKAGAYSPRITSEVVGRYLIEVLEFCYIYPNLTRPKCPWL